jgi:hypothetical protein
MIIYLILSLLLIFPLFSKKKYGIEKKQFVVESIEDIQWIKSNGNDKDEKYE